MFFDIQNVLHSDFHFLRKRCVCETQMLPMMANFKDDQVHMDKCLDISSKILSQKMLMRDIKALTFTVEKVISRV